MEISASTFNFEMGKYYSLFVTGSDSAYRNVVAVDNFDSLSAADGKALCTVHQRDHRFGECSNGYHYSRWQQCGQ